MGRHRARLTKKESERLNDFILKNDGKPIDIIRWEYILAGGVDIGVSTICKRRSALKFGGKKRFAGKPGTEKLNDFIREHAKFSAEEIANRWKAQGGVEVSRQTIYDRLRRMGIRKRADLEDDVLRCDGSMNELAEAFRRLDKKFMPPKVPPSAVQMRLRIGHGRDTR